MKDVALCCFNRLKVSASLKIKMILCNSYTTCNFKDTQPCQITGDSVNKGKELLRFWFGWDGSP
jgi:hypothetical protein